MGTKRVGLARMETLIENLKRTLSMKFATVLQIGQLDLFESGDTRYHSFKTKTADLTLGTGSTTHDIAGFFPANSIPLAITVTVTTAITNNGFITDIGTDGDGDVFVDGLADTVLEELADTVTICSGWGNSLGAADVFTAADALRITTNANPSGGGAVRVTMTYIDASNA